MRLLLFQDRFFPLVVSGQKKQTIRAHRKDGWRPVAGELLRAGRWTGKPYRSKVERGPMLRVTGCEEVDIHAAGPDYGLADAGKMAKADGFASAADMVDWFSLVHGLPFFGVVIRWEKI